MSVGLGTVARMERELAESVRFIWDQAADRLEAQLRQADALDTKAGVLIGLHALGAGILGSALDHFALSPAFATLELVLFLISGGIALLAFRSQTYDRSPRPEELWPSSMLGSDELRLRFLTTRFRAIERNRERLRRKARALTLSVYFLFLIALISAASAMESVWR